MDRWIPNVARKDSVEKKHKTPTEIRKQCELKKRKKAEKIRDELKKICWTCWKDYTATKCSCPNALVKFAIRQTPRG